MVKVAVAGGLGDLGQAIVAALQATHKHEVYILSRASASGTQPEAKATHPHVDLSNLTILPADYNSISALTTLLHENAIHTVISALNMSSDAVSKAQCNLIRAAQSPACPSVQRFVPSEYNVNYDLPDDVLPYPPKHFHRAARRMLEQQQQGDRKLEFAYFYFGSFMEYIGLPRLRTHLRPIYLLFDFGNLEAAVPIRDDHKHEHEHEHEHEHDIDGFEKMVMTRTDDGARYVAAALDLPEGSWPCDKGAFAVVGSICTPVEVVKMAEAVMERKIKVRYDRVEDLRAKSGIAGLLPGTLKELEPSDNGEQRLRGRDQAAFQELLCNLATGVGMGAFDLLRHDEVYEHGSYTGKHEVIDIVKLMGEKVRRPTSIEELLRKCWAPNVSDENGIVVLD